jgi:predicted DNA-binding transcriptional regulator AlpA
MKWLTRKEVSEKLGVSMSYLVGTLSKTVDFPKEIRPFPRKVVYDNDEVEKWMRSKLEVQTSAPVEVQTNTPVEAEDVTFNY